jgi:Ser/Thr protein kinase RdoA (MazF antagonist)
MSASFDLAFYLSAVPASLKAFGIESDAQVTLIKHRENAVFKVEHGTSRMVLRMHRPGYRSLAELQSEAAWTFSLRQAGVPTPAHVAGTDEQAIQIIAPAVDTALFVDMLEWIDGVPPSNNNLSTIFAEVGRLAALIHAHSRHWTRPAGFARPVMDQNTLFGPRGVWGDFAELAGPSDSQRRLFRRLADKVRRDLSGFAKTDDTWGLVHGDLMPENILQTEQGVMVIDFDDGGESWLVGDLATSLGMYLGTEHFDPLMGAWLEGYATVTDPQTIGLEYLPTLIGARLLQGLGWMHTRRDSETAVAMTRYLIEAAVAFADDYLSGERPPSFAAK